ncbi:PrsW family intramembrane metalloprotease [Leptospira ognonensis]|uniref:PrsW family intramembrane metalloprotease n=1 Tax=Leptospira ognonensis TaxID=2484945 RepID=A0A4R9K340_9LEPT|nr:PrsW family glutamic-type intramembrane protease [Leptospira ognonensis]TGL59284.1 PrsW family intramembrane metalloprotease [Leptospira ognonensis]
MSELKIEIWDYVFGTLSIFPWAFAIYKAYTLPKSRSTKIGIVFALLLGWVSTVLIIWLHPILWPQTDFVPKRKVSLLTSTAHLAFIQAGMMEETFKISFILLLSFALGFDYEKKNFRTETVLFSGFVALGFSLVENTQYIAREISDKKFEIFLARTIHSSNIHLLINLCFGFFMLKSNGKENKERIIFLFAALGLAILQHGVVDFLLIPGAVFGQWVATALFVGIWVWVVRDWRVWIVPYFEDKKTLIPASEYSSQSY